MSIDARGLRDDGWNRGEVRGRVVAHRRAWGVGVSPNLTSDPELSGVLHQAVDRVFAPYLRSRAWTRGAWRSLYVEGTGDLYQRLRPVWPNTARSSIRLGVAPTRVVGPLGFAVESGIDHWIGPDVELHDFGSTWIHMDPSVALAANLGPVRFSASGSYRLRVVRSDRAPTAIHAGLLAVESSVPLARRFGRGWVHLVEPVVGGEWSRLEGDVITPDGVVLMQGGQVQTGLRTELWSRLPGRLPQKLVGLWAGAVLPLEQEMDLLVNARLDLVASHLTGDVEISWVPWRRLAALRFQLCTMGRLSACAGYARFRTQRVGEVVQHWPGTWVSGGVLLPLALSPDQLHVSTRVTLGPVAVRGTTAWDPAGRRHAYSDFGIDTALGCGCYRVGLVGAARAGQRWPDVALTFDVATLSGDLGCR